MSKHGIGQVNKTEHGFELIKFQDLYHIACSLQQSSLARYTRPGTSAIWLGRLGTYSRMHLDRSQVKRLIISLQRWIDAGSFAPKRKRNSYVHR